MNGKIRRAVKSALATALVTGLAALAVVSCGGGGGSLAGIDRLGISSGTITGFGSIFVNGVEWSTTGASITIDDAPGTESELRIGQVVTVRGTLSADGTQGRADSVDFANSVEGAIASINLAASSFVVVAQTVIVSADTEFDNSVPDRTADAQRTLADLDIADVVEVSGYRDSTGAVRATRIGISGAAGPEQVKGVVSQLNTGAMTFHVGSLVVDYTGATLTGFGTGTLINGNFVKVRGSLAGGTLTADTVQLQDSPSEDVGHDGEVEGYITRFVSATDFDVSGVSVTTDGNTVFEGGTAGSLDLNVKVEVEGQVNDAGVIVADTVKIRVQPDEASVEIIGNVDAVDLAAGTVTIRDMDVVIKVNDVTRFEDDSSADVGSFSLANVQSGDHVEIRAAEDLSTAAVNDAIATRLKREDPDDGVVLQGPVQAIEHPDISILGVQVATDTAVFLDADGNAINDATFFANIAPGHVVKATTTFDRVLGNLLLADEAQIRDGSD